MTTSWTGSGWETKPERWARSSRLESSSTHELIRSLGGATQRDLVANLLAFCRVLRTVVPNVTAGRVIDTCRSLACIDLSSRDDFHTALLANLVSSQEDMPAFEALYQLYWDPLNSNLGTDWMRRKGEDSQNLLELNLPISQTLQNQITELLAKSWEEGDPQEKPDSSTETPAYSSTEVLAEKNFEDFTADEIREMRRILEKLSPLLATAVSRRTTASFGGPEIDLRRSFRQNMRYGGEIIKLARKRKKVRKLRIALLCDVSGSMDRYSRFLLQFVYGLENEMTGVDAWVFSTRLTEVTPYLRGHSYDEGLERIAQSVHDWSGGTAIGNCLFDFVQGPGRGRITRRTIVIIISDGWDRGDVRTLERAMQSLKRQAHTVIWLNPLLGSPSYQPLCAGMQTALPYTDFFLPAHNLNSLLKLTKSIGTLSRAM